MPGSRGGGGPSAGSLAGAESQGRAEHLAGAFSLAHWDSSAAARSPSPLPKPSLAATEPLAVRVARCWVEPLAAAETLAGRELLARHGAPRRPRGAAHPPRSSSLATRSRSSLLATGWTRSPPGRAAVTN